MKPPPPIFFDEHRYREPAPEAAEITDRVDAALALLADPKTRKTHAAALSSALPILAPLFEEYGELCAVTNRNTPPPNEPLDHRTIARLTHYIGLARLRFLNVAEQFVCEQLYGRVRGTLAPPPPPPAAPDTSPVLKLLKTCQTHLDHIDLLNRTTLTQVGHRGPEYRGLGEPEARATQRYINGVSSLLAKEIRAIERTPK